MKGFNKSDTAVYLPRRIKKELLRVDWTRKDVLVGSVRSDEQLKINLKSKFYHTPAKYISQADLPIRRIAVYQSSHSEEPGIRYYADVLNTRVVRRGDIPIKMTLNNSEEQYYLFDVGEWRQLTSPILAGTDAVREPRFTNTFLLGHSAFAYELFSVGSEDEFVLLYTLKSMLAKFCLGEHIGSAQLKDGLRISVSRGFFEFFGKSGKLICKYRISDFMEKPKNVFEGIKENLYRQEK